MNAKNFLVSGIVGGIVNYLLGWLLYGIVFKDQFPVKEGEVMNMTMIAMIIHMKSCMCGYFVYLLLLYFLVDGSSDGSDNTKPSEKW